ncbi:hypothetical protein Q4S45_15335 [Massilia sp. R2A-15]|uniref:WD40/YVTN/BNR-like repeat-containing protein n=1 Tax=Massilia sp. R2A-15 TaxID=3064278 RepID=UPI002736D20E|nr:hypothetical protein [Massilia sp. R2A-15]WLI88107.1 hypothetical protein Q4S45_15335 [Massilia sp. R2A-15]
MTCIRAAMRLGALCFAAGTMALAGAQTATDDSGYRSAQDFRMFQAAGGGEEQHPTVIGRLEWQKARFGTLPSDFGQRMVQEWSRQRSTYPQLAPGAAAPNGVPVWQSIGPTRANKTQNDIQLSVTDSGRLRTILPHPTDPNTVYLLSSSGGMWKTSNFEAPYPTWLPITDKVITTSGGAAAMGRDPQTLYYGTGDPFDGIPLVGGAMLKTTDGGNSWSPFTFLGNSGMVLDVKVDMRGAKDMVLVATDSGIYRSDDGGSHYTNVLNGGRVWSLARSSIGWLATVASGGYYDPATLYVSADGSSWAPIAATNMTGGAGRITLGIGAPGDAVVYAYVANSCRTTCDQKDLYRSADGGYSWTALGLHTKAPVNPNEENPTMDLMGGQGFYNHMIVVDPTDATRNTVYLGGQLNTGKTTDGGRSWRLLSNWLGQFGLGYVHADHHTAVISMAGGKKRVMFGTDGGLFVSKDEGASWSDQKNVGLVDHLIYSMATSGADPKSVLIGLQDNGTRIRSGNTGVFNQSFGGDGFGVGWSQAAGNTALGSYVYGYIYSAHKDPNIQKKWTDPAFDPATCSYNGINACNAYFVTPIATPSAAADPVGSTYFTNTASLIYRTDNAGASWRPIFAGSTTATYIRGSSHSVSVSPVDLNHVAAVSTGGRILITSDGGASWKLRSNIVAGYAGFNSNIAYANNSVLYVASENPGGQSVWVVKSTDGGVTWAPASTGLPNVPIQRLLAAPNDLSGNTVYAATWLGVYRTTNGGASWTQFGAGLPTVQVSDLYMPRDGSFLRASTYGRGVWDISTR